MRNKLLLVLISLLFFAVCAYADSENMRVFICGANQGSENETYSFEWEMKVTHDPGIGEYFSYECTENQMIPVGVDVWIVVRDTEEAETKFGMHEYDNVALLDIENELVASPTGLQFHFEDDWTGIAMLKLDTNSKTGLIYFTNDKQPHAYVPMIRDGRVWEYSGDYFMPGEEGLVHHFMKFDGMTTVNDRDYTCFVLYRSDFYKSENGHVDNTCDRTEMRTGPRFFVREENEKVFVLVKEDFIYYTIAESESDWIEETPDASSYTEYALYDFSLSEGTSVPVILDGYVGGENEGELSIHWIKPEEYGDVKRKVYQFVFDDDPDQTTPGDGKVIEGIGITCNGHLACYDNLMNTAIFNDNSFMPGQHSSLVSVMESDGTYIYGNAPNSVQTISSDSYIDQPIYDVMGRQVKETVPGSIYIRGGKKFVAK